MCNLLRVVRSSARVTARDPWLSCLAVICYVLLIGSRAVIQLMPLRRIVGRIGTPMHETTRDALRPDALRFARRVGWTISRVAPYTPTNSNCYPQALTATLLLRCRRVPATVYYGAGFTEDATELSTHVWVRVGDLIVTGAAGLAGHSPLAAFAYTPSRAAHPIEQFSPSNRASVQSPPALDGEP